MIAPPLPRNHNAGMSEVTFRIGADESTGAPGWEIDDIAVSGLWRNPFAAHVAETQSCRVRP